MQIVKEPFFSHKKKAIIFFLLSTPMSMPIINKPIIFYQDDERSIIESD